MKIALALLKKELSDRDSNNRSPETNTLLQKEYKSTNID